MVRETFGTWECFLGLPYVPSACWDRTVMHGSNVCIELWREGKRMAIQMRLNWEKEQEKVKIWHTCWKLWRTQHKITNTTRNVLIIMTAVRGWCKIYWKQICHYRLQGGKRREKHKKGGTKKDLWATVSPIRTLVSKKPILRLNNL